VHRGNVTQGVCNRLLPRYENRSSSRWTL
jgi:hypothetical protein